MSDQDQAAASPPGEVRLDDVLSSIRETAETENLSYLSAGDIEALARSMTGLASDYTGKEPLVRVRDARGEDDRLTGTTVLETVTRDKPFLVDSLLGLCADLGLEVRALFHPILKTDRDIALSLIQIHVPALSAAECRTLKEGADATLRDVAMAVADFSAMHERMKAEIKRLEKEPHCSGDACEDAMAFLKWLADDHFVFLGVRTYEFETGPDGSVLPEEPIMVEGSNLGLLRDEDRNVLNRGAEPLVR